MRLLQSQKPAEHCDIISTGLAARYQVRRIVQKVAQKILGFEPALPRLETQGITSISDNYRYPQACLQAANDYRLFNVFRQNKDYTEILEHATHDQGAVYLNEIKKNSDVLISLPDIAKNDTYGGPVLHSYPGISPISPSTLRYAKVLCDLFFHFGSLDGFSIAEIGVGYGGQCRAINAISSPRSYTLVDLQPVLQLSQRYLDHYILKSQLTYLTLNQLTKCNYDLLISNYAFSELPRAVQDVYLEKIILPSVRGYMTYNQISPESFKSYSSEELLKLIPGSTIVDEVPLTHPMNCIIIWGQKNKG